MSLKIEKMQTGKRTKKGKKMIQQKLEMFRTQNNFLENTSMWLPLFNPYAPMHKFCACL